MSLYHDYRPNTLEEVSGNTEISESLKNLLSNLKKCPHVFLFHGPTGCGKTTLGRIIAKQLGCNGSDYKEIDSSQFRGIDTVRDLTKQSQYMPLEGKSRVWLIDECHKMTNDAQNAFLKTLEDPPAHAYFILCTTEVNKVISAIVGRCQTYQVKVLNTNQMLALLKKVVKAEKQKVEDIILEQIAEDSLGHPRNALQILEQVLSVRPEKRLEVAKRSAVEQSQTINLCRALVKGAKWKEISTILSGLTDQDPESIRRAILGYCQAVLLKNDNERIGLIMENMIEPFYNSGFPGLVFSCYSIVKS